MRAFLALLFAVGFFGAGRVASGAPRISEVMADNASTLADADGDYTDWIEIHNPDPAPVNLAGYALTDSAQSPGKWVFPNVTLPGGSFLVVFASGKNRTNPAAQLHTNFSLNSAGEYLALIAPDGVTKLTEFSPAFPPQEKDKSYGDGLPSLVSTPVAPGAPCRWFVPTSTIPNWTAPGYSDAAWNVGHTGVGYERVPGSAFNFTALISPDSDTNARMFNVSATCYIRIPFTVADPAKVESIMLKMKYDDGYIAYLNGTQVASGNPSAGSPVFDSTAPGDRPDSDAIVYENRDIGAFKNLLVAGTNLLAVHGLNETTASPDFLILPEIEILESGDGIPLLTGYFQTPTPGTANGTPVDGFVKDTKFSVDRGFFAAPFSVAITTATAGAEIRYTTNGSAPTATTGTVYTGPVNIATTTVLRAAAFRSNWQPSNVDTRTYIFAAAVKNQTAAQPGFPTTWGHAYNFSTGVLTGPLVTADYEMDTAITNSPTYSGLVVNALENTLPVLSVVADTNAIFGPSGIYSDARLDFGTELPASVEFFGPGSGAGFHQNCGLRIHGGDALVEHPKKPFRLYFRKKYGAANLEFPLYPDSPVRKFDRLQLRPGGHDGWAVPFGSSSLSLAFHATYIRDVFLRQTEQAQRRLAPHSRFAHLYINGLYWGFYDIHEVPSNDYFKSHVGGKVEDWDVVEHPGNTTDSYDLLDGTPDDLEVLLSLCRPASRPADPLIFDQIGRYIDMDEFIDHMIVMIWAGQNDWMGPVFRDGVNYSRFFNKNWTAGRLSRGPSYTPFLFSSWDAEISMGSQLVFGFTGQRVVNFDFTRVGEPGTGSVTSPFGIPPGPPAEIYHALRSNENFRRRFADRLYKHFFNDGAMTVARNKARLLALRNTLMLPTVPESARWGDVNGVDFARDTHWTPEMDWLDNTFLTQRNAIVLSQFQARGLYTSVLPPGFSKFGGVVLNGFHLTMTDPNPPGGTIYYTLDGSDPYRPAGPVQAKLISTASPCKYWIPDSGVLGDTWKDFVAPANIGIWTDATSAIGADSATTYPPYITANAPEMITGSTSMYIRIPFVIASQAERDSITDLKLRIRYDDGFRVYLNGAGPVTARNAPATAPAFNDAANFEPPDKDALVFEIIDWSAEIPNLIVGTNYLCIHALNAAGSDDFLISPELIATTGFVAAGPSPAALPYIGPVPLPQSGPVLARVRTVSGQWSPLAEATFVVGTAASNATLVVSELNYNPSGPTLAEISAGFTDDSDFEYIELYNPTSETLELTALRFIAGIDFDFINSSISSVAPFGRVLIVKNAAAFAVRYGSGRPVAGEFASGTGLSNSGERIVLLDAIGATIFDFTYGSNAPWPDPPAGSGFSLVLRQPEAFPDATNPVNWRLSGFPDGSPGGDDRTDFYTWLAANGGTGNEASDTDEDEIANLTEYFLGSPPNVSSVTALPVAGIRQYSPGGVPANYLTLTFRRMIGAEDLAYFVEFGSTVDVMNMPGILADTAYNLDGTMTETWRSPMPVAGAASQFGRVRIVR